MDDDLGTPAALTEIHLMVRDGNRALDAGQDASDHAWQVGAMLDVLGLHPADDAWSAGESGEVEKLRGSLNVFVLALLDEREHARSNKDWARADAIRDQIKAAGIEVEDTPTGPKWSV
jgi:cysteinyl-tRNA synthetase